jgi:LAO/AO transport system kinase
VSRADDPEALVARAVDGDRRAVGRLLTLVEKGGDAADLVAERTHRLAIETPVVGITGAPGSGKSTMVAGLVAAYTAAGRRPAVLAIDPSSPLTGGAILGDRVRMAAVDTDAFVRSLATRGHAGGLALAVPGAVRVLAAGGFDPVLVETVGVGQVEVDVTAAADTTVVVVPPGMGDAVQANKAGLLEVADVFVVNKADRPGADDTRRDLELMLDLGHVTGQEEDGRRPPVLMVDSLRGDGIDEVGRAIDAHRAHLTATGRLAERRRRRARHELTSRAGLGFDTRLRALMARPDIDAVLDEVVTGTTTPGDALAVLRAALAGDP